MTDIRRFQRDFGLAEDGIMLPGGETRRTLAPLVEAKVAAEIGDDPANPRPFSPTLRPAVVRQVPGQPTARAVPVTAAIGTDDDNSRWPASWDRTLYTMPEFRHMVVICDYNETSSGTGNHLLHGRIDEAIASGDSATVVALTQPLTFTREGDTIHVSGVALGTRIDRYDFEKGKSSADLPLQARSVGDGQPYTHVVTWPLQVNGRIRIVNGVLQRPELEFADPPEGDRR
ncbi:MAG: peptidoglycan-binding domain-containing protein [Pseudomonadota bacterium]|nr:peptidoglycan-binding domain-containing protein [Pseudomonadota bacterium]